VSSSAAGPGDAALTTPSEVDVVRQFGRLWWLWIVTGLAWVLAALVILQFESASITTIGIIVGCMFLFSGLQQLVVAFAAERLRWLWAIFGGLFLVFGVVCFINPEATFAGLADMLGFLFLVVGVWWTLMAFVEREENGLWWLGLLSGVLMIVVAFWTSGQFFLEKAYTLLVFAGIWALLHGIGDIVRAFQVRSLREAA
jgi:uncharacterized membrane protein HdeD (DUF308 family)